MNLADVKDKKFTLKISIDYGNFSTPVDMFERILEMIPASEIKAAFLKANIDIPEFESNPETWNLHLYTEDTRISIFDANSGYDGDSPRGKTHKILEMAGFKIPVERIIGLKEDLWLTK